MPDGDVYDRHTPRYWHTAAKRVYEEDSRAVASLLWSLKQAVHSLGGFPGLQDIANVVSDACEREVVDQDLIRRELDRIEQLWLSTRTSYATKIAHRILMDPGKYIRGEAMADYHGRCEVFAREVLTSYAIDQIDNLVLSYELQAEKGLSQSVQRRRRDAAREALSSAPELADLAREILWGTGKRPTRSQTVTRRHVSQADILWSTVRC